MLLTKTACEKGQRIPQKKKMNKKVVLKIFAHMNTPTPASRGSPKLKRDITNKDNFKKGEKYG